MKSILASTLLALLASSCGSKDGISDAFGGTASDPALQPTATPVPNYLRGGITSAFDLTVDGVAYRDSEDFFTQQVRKLPVQLAAAGNDLTDRTVRFTGRMGLADLWKDMVIFVQPISGQGSSGYSAIQANGQFSFLAKGIEPDAQFQIRAVKRIGVEIVKDNAIEKLYCFILSAREQTAQLNTFVNLNTFDTQLTEYACEANQGGMRF
jgi:hypothetical protein